MKDMPYISRFLIIITVVILSILFIQVYSYRDEKYIPVSNHLNAIKKLNSQQGRYILMVRAGMLTNYDVLVDSSLAISETLKLIESGLEKTKAGFILPPGLVIGKSSEYKTLEEKIAVYSKQYGKELDNKAITLEIFKARSSILRNSITILPVLSEELVAELEHDSQLHKFAHLVEEASRYVLIFESNNDEEIRKKAFSKIEQMESANIPDADIKNSISNLAKHSRIILLQKPEIDEIIDEILGVDRADIVDNISNIYNQKRNILERESFVYQSAIYLVAISLSIYLIIILLRLRKTSAMLSDGNRNLEKQIDERTKELKNSEERFQLAVEGSNDGIWDWNVITNKVYYAPRFKEILGYSDNELGDDITDWSNLLHPDDYNMVMEKVYNHFKTNDKYVVEYRLKTKSGEYKWCQAKGQALRDKAGNVFRMAGSLSDISERKTAEQELEKTRSLYQAIVEDQTELICRFLPDTTLTFVNGAYARYFGKTPEELVGTKFLVFIPENERAGILNWLSSFAPSNNVKAYEHKVIDSSGRERWQWWQDRAFFDDSGNVKIFQSVGFDITDRKNSEKEIEKAKFDAEKASRSKSEFLANMSHEIRTPMNGVIGMTNLLLDTELSQAQRQKIDVIRKSGETLLEIINDILDLSKIEAGKLSIEPVNFNLPSAVSEVIDLLLPRAKEKGLDIIFEYSPVAPEFVIGDPGRIRQIIVNLVGNAIKFTDRGYVKIVIECLKKSANTANIQIRISDTGIGIPSDKLKLIFNKFSQADETASRRFGGTGLGLAICKRLAEMMGGKIWVESVIGKGSNFFVDIPLPIGKIEVSREGAFAALNGLRVMVFDCSELNNEITKKFLNEVGIEPEFVSSESDALDKLSKAEVSGAPYNIAIIDNDIRGITPSAMAEKIKAGGKNKGTTLIFTTSYGVRGEAKQIEEAGFMAYLVRPFEKHIFLGAIKMLIDARARGKTLSLVTRHSVSEAGMDNKLLKQSIDKKEKYVERMNYNLKVLVAEDNQINQMVTTKMLEKLGCKSEIAVNGKVAIEMLKNGSYDILFMDCQMPEMDGFEATGEIRKLPAPKGKIPIIALTANALRGDREKCLEAGMDDYLAKPVKQEEIGKILGKYSPIRN